MNSTDTGLMARLREETRPQHAAAEQRPVEQALVRGTISEPGYIAWLGSRRCLHAALERTLDALRGREARVGSLVDPSTYQTGNIDADLAAFGVSAARVPPVAAAVAFERQLASWTAAQPASVLGAYYVFEGSKNGARFIARALQRTLLADRTNGGRYLDPHGDAQPALWQAFKAAADALSFTPAEADAIVAAARATFDCISRVDDELVQAGALAPARDVHTAAH